MKNILKAVVIAFFVSVSAAGALAQSNPVSADSAAAMSTGEIRKVEKSAGKLTIKHGPLVNLGMDAMTMVFKVSDPAMLDTVKAGDKIDFVAEEPNGQLTVTKLIKK